MRLWRMWWCCWRKFRGGGRRGRERQYRFPRIFLLFSCPFPRDSTDSSRNEDFTLLLAQWRSFRRRDYAGHHHYVSPRTNRFVILRPAPFAGPRSSLGRLLLQRFWLGATLTPRTRILLGRRWGFRNPVYSRRGRSWRGPTWRCRRRGAWPGFLAR